MTVRTAFLALGKTDSPVGQRVRAAASDFKTGWDRAREDGVDISPELRQAYIDLGVAPDQVQNYVDHMMDSSRGRPDVNDYSEAVVVPFDKDS